MHNIENLRRNVECADLDATLNVWRDTPYAVIKTSIVGIYLPEQSTATPLNVCQSIVIHILDINSTLT